MQINERVVIKMPKTLHAKSAIQHTVWAKKAITRAILTIRAKILEQTGDDIFNVFVMTDCIEVTIRGDMEARHLDRDEYKPWANKKWRKERRAKTRK